MTSLLANFQSSWKNIINPFGFENTIVGMLITFAALAIIVLCIAAVPHLLFVIKKYSSKEVETTKDADAAVITDEIVAAIGLAYHSFQSAPVSTITDEIAAAIGLAYTSLQSAHVSTITDDIAAAIGLAYHSLQSAPVSLITDDIAATIGLAHHSLQSAER